MLQWLQACEAQQDELAFLRAVVAGLADGDAGRVVPLEALNRALRGVKPQLTRDPDLARGTPTPAPA